MEESIDLYRYLTQQFQIKSPNICTYSPLTLAYIGDGIYEIIIRTMVVAEGNEQVNKLHKKVSQLVKAKAQADMILSLMDELTEEEVSVYRRGRNAKSHTAAKNADIIDYRTATGFEALMGYLYLTGQMERMLKLIKQGLENLKGTTL